MQGLLLLLELFFRISGIVFVELTNPTLKENANVQLKN